MPKDKPDLAAYKVLAREIDTEIAVYEQRIAALRDKRDRLLVIMRENGLTYDQMGEVLGVTRNRAWQLAKAV